VLGQRLRALRKERRWSQEKLGDESGLSGKFIGEVERGEKSISVDSLYRVSLALAIPLKDLTDVRPDRGAVPTEEAEKVFALLTPRRNPEELGMAYVVLRVLLGAERARGGGGAPPRPVRTDERVWLRIVATRLGTTLVS
jgi:transcriptional regulator with XRE-family HTH domain